MSSLICLCAYCTPENGKESYLEQTLACLKRTVNLKCHRVFVINNGNYVRCLNQEWFTLIEPGKNLGTAAGINLALKQRKQGEFVVKCDDDWTTPRAGWVEKMEKVCVGRVGIVGLKRDDVYGTFEKEYPLWWTEDIFGTCTMYNPKMLDKVGGLMSPSVYGYDDVCVSVRSIIAGFRNCFRVDIPIKNLDTKDTGYVHWKKKQAGVYLTEVANMIELMREGVMPIYYEP